MAAVRSASVLGQQTTFREALVRLIHTPIPFIHLFLACAHDSWPTRQARKRLGLLKLCSPLPQQAGWPDPFHSHTLKSTRLCPIHHQRLVREAITAHQFCSHTLLAPVCSCSRQNIPLCPGRLGPLHSLAIIPYTLSSKSRTVLVDPNPSGSLT
ncbi:hypothetical protein BB8028_0002g06990 [Beauveria bassiana]|uniref:Uncharacterized protein n=1 Tax=Beauveria bassiana TaxID=176275 RepID=A0A2S7Y2I1_BEABA|nr:hypothetical protein BB8028_0002g06990 [Beauveria bassiana]